MKRAHIHIIFALFACCFAVVSLWQAYGLHQYKKTVAAVNAVPATLVEQDNQQASNFDPAVSLQTASALSDGGEFETAETLLVQIADQNRDDPMGQAARFNLANHYFRESLRDDLPGAQARPLVQIAKQRYRDLLLQNPDDWDARVNLEYALRVSPELADEQRERNPAIKSVDVVVPDFTLKDLP